MGTEGHSALLGCAERLQPFPSITNRLQKKAQGPSKMQKMGKLFTTTLKCYLCCVLTVCKP